MFFFVITVVVWCKFWATRHLQSGLLWRVKCSLYNNFCIQPNSKLTVGILYKNQKRQERVRWSTAFFEFVVSATWWLPHLLFFGYRWRILPCAWITTRMSKVIWTVWWTWHIDIPYYREKLFPPCIRLYSSEQKRRKFC